MMGAFFLSETCFWILPFCVVLAFLRLQQISCLGNHYQNCSQPKVSSCGKGARIKFPFYIQNQQDPFCGYPGFNVSCNLQGYPVIKLHDDHFLLRDVNYNNHSIRVVNSSFSGSILSNSNSNSCLPFIHSISLDEKFQIPSSLSDLLLLYRCNLSQINGVFQYKKKCFVKGLDLQTSDFAVIQGNQLLDAAVKKCEAYVKIPIVDGNYSSDSVETLLRRGFWLNWNVPSNCSYCEDSGGACGFDYDTNRFACFCADKVHYVGCRPSEINSNQSSRKIYRHEWKMELVLGGGGAFFMILLVLVFFFSTDCRKRKKSLMRIFKSSSYDPPFIDGTGVGSDVHGIPIFSYAELEVATANFSSEKEVGDGAFGVVYYGKLKDGREVAVKRMYERNYRMVEQFMNEIEILTRIRHKYLVSLYGCTSRRSKELLLVYEYVPNGTVFEHLHGKRDSIAWGTRMDIAIETASALVYLHASDIIHRDVKTNNILLDKNFTVKVADFGLSRLFPDDKTHVSTAPQGTPGYVDPEYHLYYQLTDKSDVYSFGVVLVELVSSLPAVDITRNRSEINLAYYAINRIQRRAYDELIDQSLGYKTDDDVRRMTVAVADLAFRCLQQDKDTRPSMADVMEELVSIRKNGRGDDTLPPPSPLCSGEAPLLKNVHASPTSVISIWASTSTINSNSLADILQN